MNEEVKLKLPPVPPKLSELHRWALDDLRAIERGALNSDERKVHLIGHTWMTMLFIDDEADAVDDQIDDCFGGNGDGTESLERGAEMCGMCMAGGLLIMRAGGTAALDKVLGNFPQSPLDEGVAMTAPGLNSITRLLAVGLSSERERWEQAGLALDYARTGYVPGLVDAWGAVWGKRVPGDVIDELTGMAIRWDGGEAARGETLTAGRTMGTKEWWRAQEHLNSCLQELDI